MMKNFGVKIIWKLEFWIKFIWKLEFWKLMFESTNEELRKQGHGFLFYFILFLKWPSKRFPWTTMHVRSRVMSGLGLCTEDDPPF